jgi:acyl-CoA synthetase (AMP-forming)/AMP-acid ligase II
VSHLYWHRGSVCSGLKFRSLRCILSGAALLDGAIQQVVAARLHVPVVQGYGMTETSLAIALTPPDSASVKKYKGMQVAPAELEGVLLTHPAIADAAVIGIPDEEVGEVPKAFVVLKGAVTHEAIMQYVAANVAPLKRIRYTESVEVIPRSASGKILRRVLVEREQARRSELTAAP